MLKRSAPVIRFLSSQNAMTTEIIDWIWKSQQGKHEETVRVVYNLINQVAGDLSPTLLQFLYAKI